MFYRLLGKLFFYFYVVPSFAHSVRKIVIPEIAKTLTKRIDETNKKHDQARRESRREHPAGSRRPT